MLDRDNHALDVVPVAVLPGQFFPRPSVLGRPEGRLVSAIFSRALLDYCTYVGATDRCGRRHFEDAESWIETRDESWPFSFESSCALLDLDSEAVRAELHGWRDAQVRRFRRHRTVDAAALALHVA